MNDGNRAAAASGGDGTFRLASLLGPGFPLRVEVTSPGYVSKTVTWPEGTRPAELGDVALRRAATIQGRVTAAGGRPLAGVQVLLDAWEARDRGKGDGWSVVTGDDGRYAFTGLPPGRYVLAGQRGSAPIQLAEGATVERDLVR
jgi:hypothetical protein